MKKILLLLLLSSFVLADGAIDVGLYDKLFSDLAKKRVGLSRNDIINLKNPFPILNEEKIKKDHANDITSGYTLNGIFGDRVKINDYWYKLGDEIDNFKIKEISGKSVILSNDSQEIKINLRQGNGNVIITYK